MHYYGGERPGVHLPFNFQLIDTPWEARSLAAAITNYEAALPPGGWPNWVLGNHDRPRVATRCGQAQARVAAVLLLTLRGTPTLYYGDELGLSDVAIEPSQVRDSRELREPGLALGRDPVRTPMPWDARENAGFTTANPWLPLNANWPTRNVARMTEESHSILTLYRRLLDLRRDCLALSIGDFVLSGGELPALVLIEAVTRLIPGVIGKEASHEQDSFSSRHLLDHPHYTRPQVFRGLQVPEALVSGNHGEIDRWRREAAIEKTSRNRPDLRNDRSG